MTGSSVRSCGALALGVGLWLGAAAEARGEEELVSCTVRASHGEVERDGTDLAPSVEEASDLALEAACALICVASAPVEAADDDTESAVAGGVEQPAEDDPDGIEACIEACATDAAVLGTMCVDAHEQRVFGDGVFASPGDTEAPSEEDEQEP